MVYGSQGVTGLVEFRSSPGDPARGGVVIFDGCSVASAMSRCSSVSLDGLLGDTSNVMTEYCS